MIIEDFGIKLLLANNDVCNGINITFSKLKELVLRELILLQSVNSMVN